MTFDVNAEDFLHLYSYGVEEDEQGRIFADSLRRAAKRFRGVLGASLILHDEQGERLRLERTDVSLDWPEVKGIELAHVSRLTAHYTLVYALPFESRLLTMRVEPKDVLTSARWQAALALKEGEGREARSLSLTTGGNAESVELFWNDEVGFVGWGRLGPAKPWECAPFEQRGADRFKRIFVEIRAVGGSRVEARMCLPLPMVETFAPVERRNGDFLELSERQNLKRVLEPLVLGALQVRIDGKVIPPLAWSLAIRGATNLTTDRSMASESPAEGIVKNADEKTVFIPRCANRTLERTGFWTGRLEAVLEYRIPEGESLERMEIEWRLFNGAVMTATANITLADKCIERIFTTFDPIWSARGHLKTPADVDAHR